MPVVDIPPCLRLARIVDVRQYSSMYQPQSGFQFNDNPFGLIKLQHDFFIWKRSTFGTVEAISRLSMLLSLTEFLSSLPGKACRLRPTDEL